MRLLKGLLLLLAFITQATQAQDLNARVEILAPQIQSANKRILNVLELAVRNFLNDKKWTTDTFRSEERIDCSFVVTITTWNGSSDFAAEAQIQSSRPVYGTSYHSALFSITDRNFNFDYTEGQPLEYSEQVYSSNLASLLAFYAYIIIGMDYDTFAPLDGNAWYSKAQTVVTQAQGSAFEGWKAADGSFNRFWLAENVNSNHYSAMRQALYRYHRKGLDVLYNAAEEGRREIVLALPALRTIDQQRTGDVLTRIFFTAKADELVQVISRASKEQRVQAFSVLSAADPSNIRKYNTLKN